MPQKSSASESPFVGSSAQETESMEMQSQGFGANMGSLGEQRPILDPGTRPDFRVVQPEVDKGGKVVYKDVGALWKNTSKAGNEFYTMKIGKLRLLVFPNNR